MLERRHLSMYWQVKQWPLHQDFRTRYTVWSVWATKLANKTLLIPFPHTPERHVQQQKTA